jgi:hypothetical protein
MMYNKSVIFSLSARSRYRNPRGIVFCQSFSNTTAEFSNAFKWLHSKKFSLSDWIVVLSNQTHEITLGNKPSLDSHIQISISKFMHILATRSCRIWLSFNDWKSVMITLSMKFTSLQMNSGKTDDVQCLNVPARSQCHKRQCQWYHSRNKCSSPLHARLFAFSYLEISQSLSSEKN